LYLVTNKHVIYGDDYEHGQPVIDAVKLNLHTNPANLTQNEEVTITLFQETNRKWLEHTHPAIDVVLMSLNIDRNRFTISPLDKRSIELRAPMDFHRGNNR